MIVWSLFSRKTKRNDIIINPTQKYAPGPLNQITSSASHIKSILLIRIWSLFSSVSLKAAVENNLIQNMSIHIWCLHWDTHNEMSGISIMSRVKLYIFTLRKREMKFDLNTHREYAVFLRFYWALGQLFVWINTLNEHVHM